MQEHKLLILKRIIHPSIYFTRRSSMRNIFHFVLMMMICTNLLSFAYDDLEEIESLILSEMQRWDVPGLAIAIVVDGEPVLTKGFGVKNIRSNEKVDEQTQFGIASNTKAFNGALLGVLVDEEILHWDDQIIKYIPTFRVCDIQRSYELTIRDLLCHRSGVESANNMWWKSTFPRDEMLQRIAHLDIKQSLRSGYLYNNLMYLLSGMTAEYATGKSWNTLVEEKLLTPLRMNHTTTSINGIIPGGNFATPHARNDEYRTVPTIWYNTDHIAPAAAINSSAVDMAKWIQFWCNNGSIGNTKILSEKQWREITSPQNILSTNYMNSIGREINFMAYGLGFRIYEYEGLKFVEHSGHVVTFRSFICMVPEKKFGVSVLTNADTSLPNSLCYEIAEQYLKIEDENWLNDAFQRHKKNITENKEDIQKRNENRITETEPTLPLSSYAGTYENPIYGTFEVIIKDNQLIHRYNNSEIFTGKLQHWHYDTFLMSPDLDFRDEQLITFQLNKHGKVSAVLFDDIEYKKTS